VKFTRSLYSSDYFSNFSLHQIEAVSQWSL
jgi:hypothetical protein